MLEVRDLSLQQLKNRVHSAIKNRSKYSLKDKYQRLRSVSQNHKRIHKKIKIVPLRFNNIQPMKEENNSNQIILHSIARQSFVQKRANDNKKKTNRLSNYHQQKQISEGNQNKILLPQMNLLNIKPKKQKLTLERKTFQNQQNKQKLAIINKQSKQNNFLKLRGNSHQTYKKKQKQLNEKIFNQQPKQSSLSADNQYVTLSLQTYDYINQKYMRNNSAIAQTTKKFIKLIFYYFYQNINLKNNARTKQNLITFIENQFKLKEQVNKIQIKYTNSTEKSHSNSEVDKSNSIQEISQQSQPQSNQSKPQKMVQKNSTKVLLISNDSLIKKNQSKELAFKQLSQSSSRQISNKDTNIRSSKKSKTAISVFERQRSNSIFTKIDKSDKFQTSQYKQNTKLTEPQNMSLTNIKKISSKNIQIKHNAQKNLMTPLVRIHTRRQSAFCTQFNKFNRNSSSGIDQRKSVIHNVNGKIWHQNIKKSDSQLQIQSRQYLQCQSKTKHRESLSIIQFTFENKNQVNKNNSKPHRPQKKKLNLNLSTPYDYTNEDGLMQKRKKYLQLHQKIVEMTEQIDELTNEEAKLTQKIQEKDQELIQLEQKAQKMLQGLETFDEKLKESNNFLSGPECPQMIQKMIYKKQQIIQNLIAMKALNAQISETFIRTTQIPNIIKQIKNEAQKIQRLISSITSCQNLQQVPLYLIQIRKIFNSNFQNYSQMIYEFQDKIKEIQQSNSNMMRIFQDWELQNQIRQKISLNSFQDYCTIEKKLSNFVEVVPSFVNKLQESVKHINKVAINRSDTINAYQAKMSSIQQSVVDIRKNLIQIKKQNQLVSKQLYKQKRFAMILQKMV